MISKINPCYKKFLNPNENFYVKILNNCSYFIYIYLEYTVNGITSTKESPVFGPNKTEFLTFPSDATHILFATYNCRTVPPRLICTKIIPNYKSTCYKVTGTICIEIPC